jgi:hypothetical protein
MGHYTTLVFKAKLKKDTPEQVIQLLERVLIQKDLGLGDKTMFSFEDVFKLEIPHLFFQCERWYMLLTATNWDDKMQGGSFYKKGDYWALDLHTEFKNYDNEIDHFIDWVTPYVVGRKRKQYLGWWQSEGCEYKINIYINH